MSMDSQAELITSSEAAKIMGITRRSLLRWEEKGWITAVSRDANGNRVYHPHHLKWAAVMYERWENIRRHDRKHLRKLTPIQRRMSRLIRTQPLERTHHPEPLDFNELKEVLILMDEWRSEHKKIQKIYADFFHDLESLKISARGVEAFRIK